MPILQDYALITMTQNTKHKAATDAAVNSSETSNNIPSGLLVAWPTSDM